MRYFARGSFFALLILCLAPSSANAAGTLTHSYSTTISELYDFTRGSSEYSIFIVEPVMAENVSMIGRQQTEVLSERVKSWITEQYIERYPHENPEELSKMVGADDFLDGNSSWIVVTDRRDATKIHATMRFAWANTEHGDLPLERYLGIKLRPETIRYEEYPLSIELWKNDVKLGFLDEYKYETRSFLSGRIKKRAVKKTRLSGSVVEIKNFIVSKDTPDDLVPLLFYFSEKTGISYGHGMTPLLDLSTLPELRKMDPKLLMYEWLGQSYGKLEFMHPSRYVLYAKPPMDIYYRMIGFQRAPEQPAKDGNTVFEMDRAKYVDSIGGRFSKRPGFELLKEGKREWVPLAHLYQGEITGIPSWRKLDCGRLLSPLKASTINTTN